MPSSNRRSRQTKILATLGPASCTKDQIRALFEAGVDVFRLNFSHGEHKDHAASVKIIREIESELDREQELDFERSRLLRRGSTGLPQALGVEILALAGADQQ